MPVCGIAGCSNRPNFQLSFFKVPKVVKDQGDATKNLSEERRRLWKAAINRKDITSEEKWERTLVCSKHFVGGKKAYLHDKSNPAWLPTLHLDGGAKPSGDTEQRRTKANNGKEKKKVAEAVSSLLLLRKRKIDFGETENNIKEEPSETGSCDAESETCAVEHGEKRGIKYRSCGVQTNVKGADVERLGNGPSTGTADKHQHGFNCNIYDLHYYETNPDKVSFYTGFPNFENLKLVCNDVESYLPRHELKWLTKECAFLLCMVKIRMNYLFADIANHLSVPVSTIQHCFNETLNILHVRLKYLVKWPEREQLRTTMPICLRENFGEKFIASFYCFELFTEQSNGAVNKVYTYPKHNQPVKYLIGVAPQGVVTFISEGWESQRHISDNYLTEKSAIVENLMPGDVVMVDGRFNMDASVNFYQAKLKLSRFSKGKLQLYPIEIEFKNTKKIASVRIHVEHVIGHILRKFRVLEGIIPVDFVKLRKGETVTTLDKLVFVACAITNLCVSIVRTPFD